MGMVTDIYFERLDQAVSAALARAEAQGVVLSRAHDFESMLSRPLAYGEDTSASCAIVTLRGKATRKYFNVQIWRSERGIYELNSYVL